MKRITQTSQTRKSITAILSSGFCLLASGLSPVATADTDTAEWLSPQDLCSRLSVKVEVRVFAEDGLRLVDQKEEKHILEMRWPRVSKDEKTNIPDGVVCGMENGSRSNWGDGLTLFAESQFFVFENGRIQAKIKRFSNTGGTSENGRPVMRGLVDEIDQTISKFEPLKFEWSRPGGKLAVAVFTPFLRDETEIMDSASLPISGTDAFVYSSSGDLLARHLEFRGKYIAVVTRGGTVAFSFKPFEGSAQQGTIKGRYLSVPSEDGQRVELVSQSDFLPAGLTAKVHTRWMPNVKTQSINSVRIAGSSEVDEFNEGLLELTAGQ